MFRQNEPADAIRDPEIIRPVVEQWRANLSTALASNLPSPLTWDEAQSAPYFTDKPAWDGYAALILWAAYEEHQHLKRPAGPVEEWAEGPAYKLSAERSFRSRYAHLFEVALWLPCDFDFVFQTKSVAGADILIGSSLNLSRQPDELNRRTWNAEAKTLGQWRKDGSDHGAPLETAARFAFSIFKNLADLSVEHRLPMLMDW